MSGSLESAAQWLERLVAMDTRNGTGDEIACAEFLRGGLAAHNPDQLVLETVSRSRGKFDSGYVMARWGTPKILLNVHIDTVPSGDGWTESVASCWALRLGCSWRRSLHGQPGQPAVNN